MWRTVRIRQKEYEFVRELAKKEKKSMCEVVSKIVAEKRSLVIERAWKTVRRGIKRRKEEKGIGKVRIVKDGNRITYILARGNENIPLLTVENGVIRVEKKRISDLEIFYSLVAALKVAVMYYMEKDEEYWNLRRCEINRRFWQFMHEHEFIEALEWLRHDDESQTAALLTEEEWEELERFWAEEYESAHVKESTA